MLFEFVRTEITDVILIKPKIFLDDRGFFLESYKRSDYKKAGIDVEFIQDNHSQSIKGVLRGLHFQKKPYEQGKLVRCIKGAIFDVAVDVRKGSATFGRWVAYELTEENNFMIWIPQGFAHAFLTLSERAEVMYKVSNSEYAPEYDAGVRWDDPDIAIQWPLKKYGIVQPILSPKDASLPYLKKISDVR